MKKILLSMTTLSVVMAFSQEKTGINTTNPQATLEIAKKTTNATNDVEGILIPRVSKNKAFLMGGNASIEESTLIYVTDVSDYTTTPVDAKVVDITETGYYLWNGTKWVTVSSKNGQEWKDGVNSSGNNLIYAKQAKSTGNDIVVTDGGNVGIGTTKPLSPMHIVTEYKGRSLGVKNDLIYDYYDGDTSVLGDPITSYYRRAGGSLDMPANLRNNSVLYELVPQGLINGSFSDVGLIQYIYRGDGTTALSDLKMSVSGRTSPDIYIKGNHNVGIGTIAPKASLDIPMKSGDTKAQGILIPRLTSQELLDMQVGVEHESLLVYMKEPVEATQRLGAFSKVDNRGFYHYYVDSNNAANSYWKKIIEVDEQRPIWNLVHQEGINNDIAINNFYKENSSIHPYDDANFVIQNFRGTPTNKQPLPKDLSTIGLTKLQTGGMNFRVDLGSPYNNTTYAPELNSMIIASMASYYYGVGSDDKPKGGLDLSAKNGGTINFNPNNSGRLDIWAPTNTGTIRLEGNVGIGTTSPGYKLDINGNMKVLTDGSQYIKGKTGSQGINGSGQTTGSYHPFLRQKTSSGHVANIGGLGDWFGFIGYDKDRTGNGYDYSLVMNYANGNVGIGTTSPTQKLHVMGNILASGTITPDYVFEKYYEGESTLKASYRMMNLSEIEAYTKEHKHLPGVPSAKEIKENGGILINRATEINLEKIEELYLHTIEQEKKIEQQQKENKVLRQEVDELKKIVKQLLKK